MNWQDRRLLDLFGVEHPILQAPMAGVTSPQLAIATSEAGGLGSIAGAMLTPEGLRQELQMVKQGTGRPFNVNFFVHKAPTVDAGRDARWRQKLAPYYQELACPPTPRGRRVRPSTARPAISCWNSSPRLRASTSVCLTAC